MKRLRVHVAPADLEESIRFCSTLFGAQPKDSVILHARTDYEDAAEPGEKRHLLRLWLRAPSFRDGDDALRKGVAVQTGTR